ncbi:MAG: CHAT domain-containing protein, partial [Acidobacteriota bacterium]
MHNLAKLLRQRGEVDDAAELLETGHAAAVAGGHLAQALSLTQALATLELQREKPARALALMDEVLAAKGKASTSDDARSWVFIHMTRSHALRKVGRVDESLASAELTLRLAEEIGIPDATWQAWHDLGRARYGVGQVDGAAEALTAAIEVIEDWRRGVARADRRSGFLDRKLPPFHRLLELELERGRTDAALRVAERTRARALADALAVAAPEPSADAEASPLELPGEAAVVAFTVTGGQLWIWSRPAPGEGPAASGGPPIEEAGRWTSVPIPEAELVTRVEDVRRALADRSLGFKAPAAELGQLLFGPIARELAGARRLLLVPDGPLWDLPFSALELDGAPLVNRFTLYSVPSLRVLAALRLRPAAGRGDPLVLAGADGSGLVAQQAGAVAEVLGVKVLAGPDATTVALQGHLESGPRLLHIAAHGIADA